MFNLLILIVEISSTQRFLCITEIRLIHHGIVWQLNFSSAIHFNASVSIASTGNFYDTFYIGPFEARNPYTLHVHVCTNVRMNIGIMSGNLRPVVLSQK